MLFRSEVVRGFRIPEDKRRSLVRDASVTSSSLGCLPTLLVVLVVLVLIVALAAMFSDGCGQVKDNYGEYSAEYQQCRANSQSGGGAHSGGGSYGGYSSGGSHK